MDPAVSAPLWNIVVSVGATLGLALMGTASWWLRRMDRHLESIDDKMAEFVAFRASTTERCKSHSDRMSRIEKRLEKGNL